MEKKGWIIFGFFILGLLIAGLFLFKQKADHKKFVEKGKILSETASSTPDYLIVQVGDSMTEYLGNFNELRVYLSEYYPGKSIDIYNYGFGSTNILSLPQRLTNWTKYSRDFQPILDIDFDTIIIESFGHNPLSDYPLEEGLKKQTETLDQVIALIKDKKPKAKIVFLATIAPNRKVYAGHLVDLSPEVRSKWAEERITYIKNHIDFANSHDIPLINVFEKSIGLDGNGNLKYIEDHTYIHPSPNGIIFISKQIADFIYENNLLQ